MESKNQRNDANFMSKFTDANMNALKHLTSRQFFEVWSNYDQDGKYLMFLGLGSADQSSSSSSSS